MTIGKLDCIMHSNFNTVMLIPFQKRLLDCASVGTVQNGFCLNDFCFTSIVEPAANSSFHEPENLVLTAG